MSPDDVAMFKGPIDEDLASGDPARIAAGLASLIQWRETPLPMAPLDPTLARLAQGYEAQDALLEVLATYPFTPPLDASARGQRLMRALLAFGEDGPAYKLVTLLRGDPEREAIVESAVRTMAEAESASSKSAAERALEYLVEYDDDHAAIVAGARAWPLDFGGRAILERAGLRLS